MNELREAAATEIDRLAADDVPARVWARDHTVWSPDPAEITEPDRLGWLDVAGEMRARADELRDFARACTADGIRTAVLCGMGGSSLAPQVFRDTLETRQGFLELEVLDTTHPDHIRALAARLDPSRTLFVISSKSGGTIETLSHLEYFWAQVPRGNRFVAITDPGSPLAALAEDRGFRRVFLNPPSIGGRYSALSYFGLVPAALVGVELDRLLDPATWMADACGPDAPATENPGVVLGSIMGVAAAGGRDKLTLTSPDAVEPLGIWIEQLVAESTGKNGRGILPVVASPLGPPAVFGDDRLFVSLGTSGANPILAWLERRGHPVERLDERSGTQAQLGAEMFRWEFATAIAGRVLGINPFDQPDVQAAKDVTRRILDAGEVPDVDAGELGAVLAEAEPPRYIALQAYLSPTADTAERLTAVALRLRDTRRTATTSGFGPRYLHSTGQLHKGGPRTGLFVQVVEPPQEDAEIPGAPYTFGTLLAAQSAGDAEALRGYGRPVARASLDELERVVS